MVEIEELLNYINPAGCTYTEWVEVGMAIKHEGLPCSVWDSWSRDDSRYRNGECEKKWNSFRGGDVPVTGGTIYDMAVKGGYKPANSIRAFGWDDEIGVDKIIDPNWSEEKDVPKSKGYSKGENKQDLIKYLSLLFQPEDHVNYVVASWKDDDGKYKPKGHGSSARTAGDLIEALTGAQRIDDVIGTFDKNAGAWIRFNPMKAPEGGVTDTTNAGVTDLRYALIESDSIDIAKQYSIISELELPVAAIVHSGGKSLHAIVRIEANNMPEYKTRVNYLYDICEKNGLKIDTQNRNPSRLSRMPGVMRGKNPQYVVSGAIGKSSWAEWKEWVESINDDLPDIESLADVIDNPPELKPCRIDGLLRQGHKMIVCGPSKAGKSFLLIQLAICISQGMQFLRPDWKCKKGKVLYVNLELDSASCIHRLINSCKELGVDPKQVTESKNLDFWNLRGAATSLDKLLPKLIRRAKGNNYAAIIIDPIYKIITGDENNASEMAAFCNLFDRITTEVGSSVIYCHHHSKGGQGVKSSMDRASGSGVFARDPDAMIDMIQIDPKDVGKELTDGKTLWRLSMTLREFATPKSFEVIYNYPTFEQASGYDKCGAMFGADQKTLSMRANNEKARLKMNQVDKLIDVVAADYDFTGGRRMSLSSAADKMCVTVKTIRRWVDASGGALVIKGGRIELIDVEGREDDAQGQ